MMDSVKTTINNKKIDTGYGSLDHFSDLGFAFIIFSQFVCRNDMTVVTRVSTKRMGHIDKHTTNVCLSRQMTIFNLRSTL